MTDWIVWALTLCLIVALFYHVPVPLGVALALFIVCAVGTALGRWGS